MQERDPEVRPTIIAVGTGRVNLNKVSLISRVLGKKLYSEQV